MYKSLRDIPNPYNATEEIRNEKYFIGRNKEIEKITSAFDDFTKSGVKKNYLIIGGKSVGKSSFLNILRNKLKTKEFLSVPFIINKNKIITPLIFFKELIDSILETGSSVDLLNIKDSDSRFTQKEIWESLTSYGDHDSAKSEREIILAEVFAHALKQNRFDFPISEIHLINDIKYICNEVKRLEYKGLVILLDEFQLLSENDGIIQLLQRLMDEIGDLIFIMSGNYLLSSESFDKIIRKSETISLALFQSHDVRDFIYKPLMNYGFTREEINEHLDHDSFSYFFRKKEHNPYYINLILHFVFDKFKNSGSTKLKLDSDITNEVINQLKLNSPNHERIAAQLNASSREQLEALTSLFPYQNINLNEIVLLNLAFVEPTEELYQTTLKQLLNDICLIRPLNLFAFKLPESITLKDLSMEGSISKNIAAEIKYNFIGDNVDELYMSHIIQSSLHEDLILDTHFNAIDHLTFKLGDYIREKLDNIDYIKDKKAVIGSFTVAEKAEEIELNSKLLTEKMESLEFSSAQEKISDKIYEDVQKATKNTALFSLPLFSQMFNNENGLYYSFVKAKIRHKIVNYENFFFINTPFDKNTVPFYPNSSITSETFEGYNIEIIDSIILKIKPQIIVFLQSIDFLELDVMLVRSMINNNFERTIQIIEIMRHFDSNKSMWINNIGFAYLCNEEYELAQKHFDKVTNKEFTTFSNLAYLNYRNNTNQVDNYLKKAEKSLKQVNPDSPFKVIHQILIPLNERNILPNNYDLVFDITPELVIMGNKAINASFAKLNHCFIFLSKIKLKSDLDKFYKTRYEYYLHYNLGQFEKAIELLDKIDEKNYDSIFRQQISEHIALDKKIIIKAIKE